MRTSTPSEIVSHIATAFNAQLTPAIWGSPGVGKSDIVRQVCAMLGLQMIDLRLSQLESTDLNGIPDRVDDRLVWLPPLALPLAEDPIPAGYNGWLLFLDEINSAGVEVQKAAYKLILDRMVGMYPLHKNCFIAAAGNQLTDRAIVNKLPSTLQSRLLHFNLAPDVDEWLLWAERSEIDFRIMSFMRFMPEALHRFSPDSQDNTFPCPRTWEFCSKLIKSDATTKLNLNLVASAVGEGTAVELVEFVETFNELPQFDEVKNNPKGARLVEKPAVIYALFSMIISKITAQNADALITYAMRYPIEYQYFMVKQLQTLREKAKASSVPGSDKIYTRIAGAMRTEKMVEWMQEYAEKML